MRWRPHCYQQHIIHGLPVGFTARPGDTTVPKSVFGARRQRIGGQDSGGGIVPRGYPPTPGRGAFDWLGKQPVCNMLT